MRGGRLGIGGLGGLCLLGWLVAASPGAAQQAIRAETLAPGIHLLAGFGNGNILVLEGTDELVLIDAQSAERVAEAMAALRSLSSKPVRHVVFTHYHEDHVGGMAAWRRNGASAIAHAAVPRQMVKDTIITEWGNWHRKAAAPDALPDRTFEDSLVLTLAGRQVHLIHPAAAHTDGDTIVWLPAENLLHCGDLVEPGASPFIDWWAGGTLAGMVAAAERVLGLIDGDTKVVPGHGRVVGRTLVEQHLRMLRTVGDRVGRAVGEGAGLDAVLAARPAAEFEALLGGASRADQFVRLVHLGLTRR